MPKPSAQVTAAGISRLAGVTRATVSNWRRRHEDFPAPAGAPTPARCTTSTHYTLPDSPRREQDDEVREEYAGWAVLTAGDVATGAPASGETGDRRISTIVVIEPGDVILPGVLGDHRAVTPPRRGRPRRRMPARPAPAPVPPRSRAAGLLVPGRLPQLRGEHQRCLHGQQHHPPHPRRLRVPLLPLGEQRRYDEAFRRLHELRATARRTADLAAETAGLTALGLTSGTLLPPEPPSTPGGESAR